MTERAEALVAKLEQAAGDLIVAVESSTPEQWSAKCSDGEWTQGYSAYHAAFNICPIVQTLRGIAEGRPFPDLDMTEIDEGNAEHAKEHADCTKSETIALIESSVPEAAKTVGSLTDDQLDRKVQPPMGMAEMTVESVFEMVLIGHIHQHLGTITDAR